MTRNATNAFPVPTEAVFASIKSWHSSIRCVQRSEFSRHHPSIGLISIQGGTIWPVCGFLKLKWESLNEFIDGFCTIGGTQTLFRNLPKVSNFGGTLRSSSSGSKIVPSYKIWVHRHILESSNRLNRLEIIDWEKLPLNSKFSKTVVTIVISVQKSSGLPNFIQIGSIILVFFVSCSSAFLKVGNHELFWNYFVYILISEYIFWIELNSMVPDFQKCWTTRDEKH